MKNFYLLLLATTIFYITANSTVIAAEDSGHDLLQRLENEKVRIDDINTHLLTALISAQQALDEIKKKITACKKEIKKFTEQLACAEVQQFCNYAEGFNQLRAHHQDIYFETSKLELLEKEKEKIKIEQSNLIYLQKSYSDLLHRMNAASVAIASTSGNKRFLKIFEFISFFLDVKNKLIDPKHTLQIQKLKQEYNRPAQILWISSPDLRRYNFDDFSTTQDVNELKLIHHSLEFGKQLSTGNFHQNEWSQFLLAQHNMAAQGSLMSLIYNKMYDFLSNPR